MRITTPLSGLMALLTALSASATVLDPADSEAVPDLDRLSPENRVRLESLESGSAMPIPGELGPPMAEPRPSWQEHLKQARAKRCVVR